MIYIIIVGGFPIYNIFLPLLRIFILIFVKMSKSKDIEYWVIFGSIEKIRSFDHLWTKHIIYVLSPSMINLHAVSITRKLHHIWVFVHQWEPLIEASKQTFCHAIDIFERECCMLRNLLCLWLCYFLMSYNTKCHRWVWTNISFLLLI